MSYYNRFQIAANAQLALNKMKQNTQLQKEDTGFLSDTYKHVFEEYDETSFEHKVKLDSYYFKALLNKVSDAYYEGVNQILANLMETVQLIYENINVKPKIYGFNSTTAFNDSEEIIEQNVMRVINDHINKSYYSLTQEQREVKFLNGVKSIASEIIIKEGVDEKTAIEFANKSLVIKELLEKICFPSGVKYRIEESFNDDSKFFDHSSLRELYDVFQEQILDISKIVAVVV